MGYSNSVVSEVRFCICVARWMLKRTMLPPWTLRPVHKRSSQYLFQLWTCGIFAVRGVITFLELMYEVVGNFLELGAIDGKEALEVLDLIAEILRKVIESP